MTSIDTLLDVPSVTQEFAWSADDVMLYALAVGAGQQDPTRELALTTENSQGHDLVALPTFANIITRCAKVDLSAVDASKIVHAEQEFELHRPLPVTGQAVVTARVSNVWDKGSGALVVIEANAVDTRDGTPLVTTRMTLFVRGAGGFGGDRGPASSWAVPSGEPDVRLPFVTRREQALLYRLTGDRNPLHSDPTFAAGAGFDRPILHGMCTYGYTGRLLLETFCNSDVSRVASMRARFARPVHPGDQLEIVAWRQGDAVLFRAVDGTMTVVDQGRLELRR